MGLKQPKETAMETTTHLDMPYIAPSQAQKHVTHNEAIRTLDALVQLAVADRSLTAPPPAPEAGERHIVAPGGSGAWSGHDGKIAAFEDGSWYFHVPRAGWIAWCAIDGSLLIFDGSDWAPLPSADATPAMLGINAAADETNRLALKSDAALFDHDGGGHQLKINKAASGETASLLFQTAYSGRAEFGLPGDDRFRIKVSADGDTWFESMVLDPVTGFVGIATDAPTAALHVNGALRVQSYSKTSLPSPSAAGSGAILHVWDEAGGSVIAFSDGGNWRRVTDREVIS
jgi:hypothetical protein